MNTKSPFIPPYQQGNSDYIPTLAYFDLFDYPLTRQELEKWLINPEIIKQQFNPGLIKQRQGFYYLKGRDDLVKIRKERFLIAEKKFRRALKFARVFRLLPSIQMMAVCNTLAFSNARESSDIDFFIITKPGQIWLTRFWLQSVLALLGIRPYDHGISIKDALCLSFFITSDNLSLEDIRLEKNDVYLSLWIAQLVPIYDPENLYEKLWQANHWVRNVLPNIYPNKPVQRRMLKKTFLSKFLIVFTLSAWEGLLKSWQYKLFHPNIKKMANQDRRVIVSNKMLKLHTNDRLLKFKNLWLEKLEKLN